LKNLCEIYAVVSSDKAIKNETRPCPVCPGGKMVQLDRIPHPDHSVTVYWRCAACAHVQIERTQDFGE
jgi:C4-type Zn-finger protein